MKRRILVPFRVLLLIAAAVTVACAAPQDQKSSKRGWLGVSIQDVTERVAREQNLKSEDGAYVTDVVDDSPADSAGIKKGDVILEFASKTIYDAEDLSKAVNRTNPGTKATVALMRKGEKKSLQVVIGKTPRKARAFGFRMGDHPRIELFHDSEHFLGMKLLTLNEQLAEYFVAPNKEGVLVEEVGEKSPADKAGLKAGDVLLRVGQRTVDEVDDVRRALEKYDEGDKVEIEVLRKGSKKTFTVEIEEMEGPWGFELPKTPAPHIQMFRGPGFGRDIDLDLDIDLPRLELRLDQLRDRIESKIPRLENQIRMKIESTLNTRSI